jgi:hypothetical protein
VTGIHNHTLLHVAGGKAHDRRHGKPERFLATERQDRHFKLALGEKRPVVDTVLRECDELLEGVMYRVQYKTNLMDPVWVDLPPNIPATDSSISVTNPIGGIPQRFYRVVIVP